MHCVNEIRMTRAHHRRPTRCSGRLLTARELPAATMDLSRSAMRVTLLFVATIWRACMQCIYRHYCGQHRTPAGARSEVEPGGQFEFTRARACPRASVSSLYRAQLTGSEARCRSHFVVVSFPPLFFRCMPQTSRHTAIDPQQIELR